MIKSHPQPCASKSQVKTHSSMCRIISEITQDMQNKYISYQRVKVHKLTRDIKILCDIQTYTWIKSR